MKLARVTKKGDGGLYGQFLVMTLLPLIVSGIVMILVCSYLLKTNIQQEADDNLQNVAVSVLAAYDYLYEGDYDALLLDGKVVLYKGNTLISDEYAMLDKIKQERNIEISIFFYDTRLITTLKDDKGNRLVGSVAADTILREVYKSGQTRFYNNVSIANEVYYAYYAPIRANDGSKILGMIGVAKPASEISRNINQSVMINVIIMCLSMLITSFFILKFANQVIHVIKYMIDFMKKLSENKLNASLSDSVTHRSDEFGVMGRMLVDLQISLRRLIERDALTGLFNRRCAEKKIDEIESNGIKYCVSIGDIDHFKKFNDSFGHECGDVVLKEVAHILGTAMNGKGFVARWGGEEFLLVFENMDLEEAYVNLMSIREELHDRDITYNEMIHKVTMTFGVEQKKDDIDIGQLIRMADDKLYEGKQNGRDRVIK